MNAREVWQQYITFCIDLGIGENRLFSFRSEGRGNIIFLILKFDYAIEAQTFLGTLHYENLE